MSGARDFIDPGRLMPLIERLRRDPRRLAVAVGRTTGVFAITAALSSALAIRDAVGQHRDPTLGPRFMRRWCDAMCRLFDVDRIVTGDVPLAGGRAGRGVLLICNHRSYMDIPAVGALMPIVFVSRADLRTWPVIGWGAQLVGTIFVNRADAGSRRQVLDEVAKRLERGLNVLNYPEGTTSDGGMLPFRPGLFRVVAGAPIEIVPVTLHYPQADRTDWVGDATFLDHLLETAAGPRVRVQVHFGEPIQAAAHPDPAQLCALVYERMSAQLAALERS
jgi:1-acyl-sn-glycerol-3-phosphate acyltransferase